jgi:hypothetical protein
MNVRFALLAAFLPSSGAAESFSIKEITYAEIEEFVPNVIDFEDTQPSSWSEILTYSGVSFGERFSGQTLMARQDHILDWHDVLEDETPDAPLTLLLGPADHNLTIQPDEHWLSMALHPIGPSIGPWPDRTLGRGSLAVRFDPPVCFLAFRTALDGMNRFGRSNATILRGRPEGSLNIRFYDVQGRELASFMQSYDPQGPIEIGYMQSGQAEPQIAGVFLQGLDLRGFAIDDVRFDPDCPLKLF